MLTSLSRSRDNNAISPVTPVTPLVTRENRVTGPVTLPVTPGHLAAPGLCQERKSTLRVSTRDGKLGQGAHRYPRNRKAGRCKGCGTHVQRGEGCVEIHGHTSWLYC